MHWLNFKRYKSDVAKQAVPPHLNAAEFARHYADKPQENTEEYLSLSGEMCWDAVVLCAHRSGALSKAKYKQLWLTVFDKQYKHFVSPDDTEIRTMADMLRAPQGCFIGIFSMRDAASPRLLHAMIGTGAGFAAGNKKSLHRRGRRGRLGKSQSGARSALAAGRRFSTPGRQ
ncbi:hypothetical protein SERRSCBI_08690 [Serratia sp. SCBI]|nr:hypothetical protein SERRSCBI_08690 [Serratia sp. SCBI]